MRRFMTSVASIAVLLGGASIAAAQAPGAPLAPGGEVKAVQAPVQAPIQAPGKAIQAPVQAPIQAPKGVGAPMVPVQKPIQAPIQKHSVAQVQSPVQKGGLAPAPIKTARVGVFGRYR